MAAWNVPLPVSIFRAFAKTFLRQDQQTMIQQAEGLKHNPRLMLIDDADRPAKWYFALKQNLIESRRSGGAMVASYGWAGYFALEELKAGRLAPAEKRNLEVEWLPGSFGCVPAKAAGTSLRMTVLFRAA